MNVPVLIEYTDSMTNVSLYLQLQGGRREGKLTSGFCFMKFSLNGPKAQICKKTRLKNGFQSKITRRVSTIGLYPFVIIRIYILSGNH